MDTPASLYLDLMKRCLVNWLYGEAETLPVPHQRLPPELAVFCAAHGLGMVRPTPMDARLREEGRDWPVTAHTMIGLRRLDNLQHCIESALAAGVPGDLIEAGVWRGGATILMRAILKAYGVTDRTVWVADSFAGVPPPDAARFPLDAGIDLYRFGLLAVPLEQVRANFARYGLLDDQVRFLKGWFRDTLPTAPPGPLAVARLDGDLYESTWDALTHLYPRLSPGGFLIVDDYGAIEACRQAVHDYRSQHGITDPLVQADWSAVYWRRSR
jgi:Macrocin-O-methyltransferase (TylF)